MLLVLFILLAGCGGTKKVPVEQEMSVEQPKETAVLDSIVEQPQDTIVLDRTAELGTFTDTRDGKTYKTTKIGEQVWMAENLNYKTKGSRCYNEDAYWGSSDKSNSFSVRCVGD
jgi:hypothetical protein